MGLWHVWFSFQILGLWHRISTHQTKSVGAIYTKIQVICDTGMMISFQCLIIANDLDFCINCGFIMSLVLSCVHSNRIDKVTNDTDNQHGAQNKIRDWSSFIPVIHQSQRIAKPSVFVFLTPVFLYSTANLSILEVSLQFKRISCDSNLIWNPFKHIFNHPTFYKPTAFLRYVTQICSLALS